MLRRTLIAALTSLLLAAGLLTAVGTTSSPATAAPRFDNSIGIVKVPTQKRRGNCAKYTLRWRFNPPTPDWQVAAVIRAPKGFSVGSEFWDSDVDRPKFSALEGSRLFQICGSSVKPGRYKVQMTMIYDVNSRTSVTKHRAPTYFRLVRR